MNTQSKPSVLHNIIVIAAIALLLLGGIGITGAAAQSAIPGDALYSVKTSIEQTRLSLAKDAGDRAQMKLSFAEQRLEEISVLVKEGRNREIKSTVLSFEASINSSLIELETVGKGDPARAAELARQINSALTRYAETLSVLAASAPDSIKDVMNRALDSTQLAGGLGLSSADDNSNLNANDNGDDHGNDNANLNANDNGDDHGNDNANMNANNNGDDHGNDNANLNANDNGDDHGSDNANMNANDNGDDHGNDNANMNANNNGDDHGNDNANLNANNNGDDHGNDNKVINGNTNANVNDNSNSNTNANVNDNSNSNTNADDGGSGKGGGGNSGGGNSGSGKGGG